MTLNRVMEMKTIIGKLENHERRILLLEEKFLKNSQQDKKEAKNKSYSGPAGGVRFLSDSGFFKNKKDLALIRNELQKKGYNYSTKSIDHALRRASSVKGPLVVLREEGKKVYIERK